MSHQNSIFNDFQSFSQECHRAAAKWWVSLETGEPIKRPYGQLMALASSELAEALEADRKGLMDDKLPHRKGVEVELADFLIRLGDTIVGYDMLEFVRRQTILAWQYTLDRRFDEAEDFGTHITNLNFFLCMSFTSKGDGGMRGDWLAAAVSYTEMLGGGLGLDLEGAVREKMAFNAQRADHKVENRKAAGGKLY